MSEFDVEYVDVYSRTSNFKRNAQVHRETFLIKVVKYTGDYFLVANSSTDTLSDLYDKIKKSNTKGFSYKQEINIKDLFVKRENPVYLQSIPNKNDISLIDFIQQYPDYFVPDKASHIFKIYCVYLVDDEAMNFINSMEHEQTIWETIINMIYRHTSCFKKISMNQ